MRPFPAAALTSARRAFRFLRRAIRRHGYGAALGMAVPDRGRLPPAVAAAWGEFERRGKLFHSPDDDAPRWSGVSLRGYTTSARRSRWPGDRRRGLELARLLAAFCRAAVRAGVEVLVVVPATRAQLVALAGSHPRDRVVCYGARYSPYSGGLSRVPQPRAFLRGLTPALAPG